MSNQNHPSLGDMYHSLDEATALDHLDDALFLIAFQNVGSMLFAGDRGVPHFIHTTPDFLLRGGRQVQPVIIEAASRSSRSRPPVRLNDELVLLMKKPIELPPLNPHSSIDARSLPTHNFAVRDHNDFIAHTSRLAIDVSTPRAQEYPSASRRHLRHVKRPSYPGPYHTSPIFPIPSASIA